MAYTLYLCDNSTRAVGSGVGYINKRVRPRKGDSHFFGLAKVSYYEY
jgi:hypothetical protein